jgi:hypothetical protein
MAAAISQVVQFTAAADPLFLELDQHLLLGNVTFRIQKMKNVDGCKAPRGHFASNLKTCVH